MVIDEALALIQERLAAVKYPSDLDDMLIDYKQCLEESPDLPGLQEACDLLRERREEREQAAKT